MEDKKIWRGNEIAIADDLRSFKQGLIDDFMKGYSTLEEAVMAQCEDCINPKLYSDEDGEENFKNFTRGWIE